MNKKELINDINEIVKEITDMLDEEDLKSFKKTLEETYIVIKTQKDLSERLERLREKEND